ncbi:V-type ATP synthase subunit F [Erysipelothrix rhusiopathiae]|uniref:V-type ATP synthase subunit F n=1 Tax=Erysipelothrix rhusiopathiae TaxID=1648 RepID=UPI000210B791|nr:V-type ATP synthase subunit F [Erysipelothrix rhusiopathiae]AGN24267.1 V-type ATPase subunit F [Erysipelothrix rhusiopathiae SY1027]AMS10972.1 ATPase [Erysipelothrix rhusiopathiae]AOO67470.1 ATP synthase subunit F [Erysipelothrix rhusiopathiae]AWU41665.1 V-type ATP synthase subunit F [Erysipelothrix rhusiopathiae]AYV34447.1 ATP synthase subunit F [Erysipelothrix rhusiopathiae]
MKMYLISDNIDTQMGLRLAGIEGVVVHEKEELKQELDKAIHNQEIGIVLLTTKIFDLDREYIQDLKLNVPSPLIVEISDRHKSHEVQSMIDETISKIIGEVV